jgi:tetratricopeptide (TPR) repeat protein
MPAGFPSAPNGAAAAASDGSFVAPPSRRVRSDSGAHHALWLLGWFGVALVIGLLILGGVWAWVTASDSANRLRLSGEAEKLRLSADQAFKAKQYERAMKEYATVAEKTTGESRVIALGNAAQAASDLAVQKLEAGEMNAAEELAQAALRYDRNAPGAYICLGRIRERQGAIDEAAKQFDLGVDAALRAHGVGGRDMEGYRKGALSWKSAVLFRDGQAHLKAGRREQASVRFAASRDADPDGEFGRAAAKELENLEDVPVAPVTPGIGLPTMPADPQGDPGDPLPTRPTLTPGSPGPPATNWPGWNSDSYDWNATPGGTNSRTR